MSDARVLIRLFEFEGPADAANLMLAAEGLTVKPAEPPPMLTPYDAYDPPAAIAQPKKPPARKR